MTFVGTGVDLGIRVSITGLKMIDFIPQSVLSYVSRFDKKFHKLVDEQEILSGRNLKLSELLRFRQNSSARLYNSTCPT